MKMISRALKFSFLAAFVGAVLMPLSAHAAKPKKINFSAYRGTYSGSWVLTANGSAGIGTVTTRIKGPKSGRSITITITGTGSASGTAFPISTTLIFDSKRKIRSTALLMGFSQPILTSNSSFRGTKIFSFAQNAAPGATFTGNPISGTVSYRLTFSKKGFSITGAGTVVANGSAASVTLSVKGNK